MRLDPLSDALSAIKNAEMVGKKEIYVSPTSKVLGHTLRILKEYGYIEDYEYIENHRGGIYKIMLRGRIHNIGRIKPPIPVKWREIELLERRFLPAYTMGLLIITTPKGILSNEEAKKERIGGRIIAYVY